MTPRSSSKPAASQDVRPMVTSSGGRTPTWVFGVILVMGALVLFLALDGQRRSRAAPAITAQQADARAYPPMPDLVIPEDTPPSYPLLPTDAAATVVVAPAPSAAPPPPSPTAVQAYVPRPPTPPQQTYSQPVTAYVPAQPIAPAGMPLSSGSALVIDRSRGVNPERRQAAVPSGEQRDEAGASGSTRVVRPALTIPEGAVIPAVLETALDSTQPGRVRAVVSTDVRGMDGSQVLIPRGSRLIGEYQSEVASGQSRIQVQWTRLIRPDGFTVSLASPAGDASGRAGIAGRVDNRTLQRFGSALLQTTLNIGAGLVGRNIGGDAGVVIALPGAAISAATPQDRFQPTVRVDAGTRVTVLVAQNLQMPAARASR